MKATEDLMLWESIMWLFGWGYVVNMNPNSKEIHRLGQKKANCNLHLISKRKYVTRKEALRLIKNEGYNGCRWCWNEKDEG